MFVFIIFLLACLLICVLFCFEIVCCVLSVDFYAYVCDVNTYSNVSARIGFLQIFFVLLCTFVLYVSVHAFCTCCHVCMYVCVSVCVNVHAMGKLKINHILKHSTPVWTSSVF